MNDLYIILTGALVAITCALLGCFLILRKMAMVGDAISHAVLPGIVIAFLISGTRD
ncbi:MAG TPA: metal ABC transporter permease, partial [Chryseosolibacter sp.]|nr:metal ABC transporter permease [Chryseosolibacter sp.]